MKERSTIHKVNQDSYAKLFSALLDGPCTAHELADVTGLHVVTVQDLMRALHRHKVVHISAWEPNSRGIDTTAVFAFGRGRDTKRRKKTRAQVALDYRERKKLRDLVALSAK